MTVPTGVVAGGPAGEATRRATLLAVVVMLLFLPLQIAWAVAAADVGKVPWVVVLLVFPFLYAFPATRRRLDRYRWGVLAAQAALTWVPLARFGGWWDIGLGGQLAALSLLTIRSRVAWLVAAALMGADVLTRLTVARVMPTSGGWVGAVFAGDTFLDGALIIFSVIRLAQVVGEVEQAHRRVAELTVARERLEATRALRIAVGQRLAEIAARTGAARRALARDVAEARAQIAAAGATARETVARARAMTADPGGSSPPEPQVPPVAGVAMGPRLARVVLVVLLMAYTLQGFDEAYSDHDSPRIWAMLAIAYAANMALQLRHSRATQRGRRPRAWPVTLAMQAAVMYVFFLPWPATYTTGVSFLAGSVLVLISGRRRWTVYAAVIVSWSALYGTVRLHGLAPSDQGAFYMVYQGAAVAATGMVIYAMSRLAGLAQQLEGLRGEVAMMAAARERLRVDRDVHDLLGLGLSTIALKSDLVGALIGRDDPRAAAELAEMTRICAAAQAEVQLVTGGGVRLSFADELAAARRILASAGVAVDVDVPSGTLPEAADEVLAPALREAVTNVLRHSAATRCAIGVSVDAGTLRLRVVNDGVGESAARPLRSGGGNGLANMTARLRVAGGRLSHSQAAGEFELTTEIPLPDARPEHGRSAGRLRVRRSAAAG